MIDLEAKVRLPLLTISFPCLIVVVRVKCSPKDTVGDLKKLIGAQKGTKAEKIILKKWCVFSSLQMVNFLPLICRDRYQIYKDHITLEDYEIHDGMSLEMH